jgi:prolipoprotein diacylglyceryltransferase
MVSFAEAYSAAIDWAEEDLLRPGLILVCGMLLFNLPTLLYKIRMFIRGILYFVLCWDKSWKKPQDPGAIFGPHLSQGLSVERKTVYFVRHGESTWNDTFNKGHHRSTAAFVIGFIPGLIKATLYELYLLLSGKLDRYVFFVHFSNPKYRSVYCNYLLHFLSFHRLFNAPVSHFLI